jgi:hypothetical protein
VEGLTKRQAEFLTAWVELWRVNQAPPTVRELAAVDCWNAQQLMTQLIDRGYLKRIDGVSRGTRLTDNEKRRNEQWESKILD